MARGERSMRHKRNRKVVDGIVRRQASLWGIRIYKYANVGNHLHLLLRPRSRRRYKGFVRAVSGLIARTILRAQRGKAKGIKFWQARPYTRIVRWGQDFVRSKRYVELNIKEAMGFLTPRMMKKMDLHPKQLEALWPGPYTG